MQSNVDKWTADGERQGVEFRYATLKVSGYPFWFNLRFENITLRTKTSTTWEWRAPVIKAKFRPWQRSRVFLDLSGRHRILGAQNILFVAPKLDAIFHNLNHSTRSIAINGEDFRFEISPTVKFSAKNALFKLNWNADNGTKKKSPLGINLALNSLTVPEAWKWPIANEITSISIATHLEGSIRHLRNQEGLIDWRNNGGVLELTRFSLEQGPFRLDGDGTFALDDNLQPMGSVVMRIKGSREIVEALLERNMIGIGQATVLKLMLVALESQSYGDLSQIKVPLSIQNHKLYLQSLKLMNFPKFEWSRIFEIIN